jgi:hypothetical protein
MAFERNESESQGVKRCHAGIDSLAAHDIAVAQTGLLIKEMKEPNPDRPTVGQSANRKADSKHAASEIGRLVHR